MTNINIGDVNEHWLLHIAVILCIVIVATLTIEAHGPNYQDNDCYVAGDHVCVYKEEIHTLICVPYDDKIQEELALSNRPPVFIRAEK